MSLFSFLGTLSPAHISIFTMLKGKTMVGEDTLGNKYYSAPPRKGYKRDRRWVIYNGTPEASNVPPEWHGWLHYQSDEVPQSRGKSFRRKWQKPHRPNMTGTNQAYRPPGHILEGGKRDKAYGDYEAWDPTK